MDKETSSAVSSIAASLVHFGQADLHAIMAGTPDEQSELVTKIRALAGSCMSQDETPGQAPTTFLDRLKIEHAHLTGKHDVLTLFLSHTTPNVSDEQRGLLELQLGVMGLYRRLLEMRLANLENDNG